MLDLVIANARIVDGTGMPSYTGDVAVHDGKIVSVGARAGEASRRIDAARRVVAPGFIDPHTHYDAQLCWDPHAKPSIEHGVTTVVPGNCSLTLAPLRAGQRGRLSRMFRQIEEMPESAFDAGIDWRWGEGFSEYLDTIASDLAINVAPLVGHSAIRLWVMGEDSAHRAATQDEIAQMQAMLRDCLGAGAVGLSTSFVDIDENLHPVPSRWAHMDELSALCRVLGECGKILQVVHEFYSVDLTLSRVEQLAELSLEHGIVTTFSPLFQSSASPGDESRIMAQVEAAWQRGARVWPQVQTRPIDLSFTLEQRSLLFLPLPSWYMTVSLPTREDKIAAFRDAETRARLLGEATAQIGALSAGRDFENFRIRKVALESNKALEGRTLGEVADERGTTPVELMIDLACEEDLQTWYVRTGIGHADDPAVGPLLAHPLVHIGAGDGGAHVASFSTYGDTGYLFSRFVRGTGALSLEQAVKKITHDPCAIWGLTGRGTLERGKAADLVVFDPETIDRGPEVEVHDLPGDGLRWVRGSVGVDATVVNGELAWNAKDGYTEARSGVIATR